MLPTNDCVVRVGEGRGFLIRYSQDFLVVTAAHCLPKFPPAHSASYLEERTYENLLGSLNEDPRVWAECFFADPVSDIAVLGCPDNQALGEQADYFGAFVNRRTALRIASPQCETDGYVLSLAGRWMKTRVARMGFINYSLQIDTPYPGMSGSPILNDRSFAIGVAVVGFEVGGKNEERSCGQPILVDALPGRFLKPSHLFKSKSHE